MYLTDFCIQLDLLQAENKARIPWVAKKISQHFYNKRCSVMDIGCGAGFLSNALAQHGHYVTGVDISEESLEVARSKDITHTVFYCQGERNALPFSEQRFDVVCAMDLLKHVQTPPWRLKSLSDNPSENVRRTFSEVPCSENVIKEASRVLKPGGLFFFHTFNRNWISRIFALKGMEWFVSNAPSNSHMHRLFIKPKEMNHFLKQHSLHIIEMCGLMPKIDKEFLRFIFKKQISSHFSFKIISSIKCGYMGFSLKK